MKMNKAIHLISYGDKKFQSSKKRIYQEAVSTGWFDQVKVYGPEDLCSQFKKEFKCILSQTRGGGYWIWKFHIILSSLAILEEGDFLIYLDSGCVINSQARARLEEYLTMLENSDKGIISFQLQHKEDRWTTEQIFQAFGINVSSPHRQTGQYSAGILIMKKCRNVVELFQKCLSIVKRDKDLITDKYNSRQHDNGYPGRGRFNDNRHDQSILSVGRKLFGSIVLPDETWYSDFSCKEAQHVPFLVARKIG